MFPTCRRRRRAAGVAHPQAQNVGCLAVQNLRLRVEEKEREEEWQLKNKYFSSDPRHDNHNLSCREEHVAMVASFVVCDFAGLWAHYWACWC